MITSIPESPGGYRWWYADAISRDGRDAMIVIFFCGAVFSPYYASRLRRQLEPAPREHTSVHVALYRDGKRVAWLLAEHNDRLSIHESPPSIEIARSRWAWKPDGSVEIQIDDHGPARVIGRIELRPLEPALTNDPVDLMPNIADHRWHAVVPRASVRADFDHPDFHLSGTGYHDTNYGSEPLERGLSRWTWGRIHERSCTRVVYEINSRDGTSVRHDLSSGRAVATTRERRIRTPSSQRMTAWGIGLSKTMEFGGSAPAIATRCSEIIENTPFYARYLIASPTDHSLVGMAETLDLTRFDRAFVRWMLAFRTYRHVAAS